MSISRNLVGLGWLTIALAVSFGAARADAILDWNKIAIESVVAAKQNPPMTTRSMAIVHAAIFDAVNAVEPRFTAYRVKATAEPGASADVAASAAAHFVLVKLFPDQKDRLDRAYAPLAARGAGDQGVAAGIKLGETVAASIVAWRLKDGIGDSNTYRPKTTPGVYVPTALPIAFDFAKSTPWLMERCDQFRPEPPPALTSATWTRDYNEIKSLGSKDSTQRTAEQTVTARFWIMAGAPSWNPILRQFVQSKKMSEVEEARLFALVYLATADTLIAVFDAKYAYNFWRPITAIRNGDRDANDATPPDPSWMPLADTPMHPEYPCAHCINAAAVGAILEAEFGDTSMPFEMTSPTAPGVTRRWTRLQDYVDEVSNARVWAGFHYRNSTEVGKDMGRKIANLAEKHFLTRKVVSKN